MLRKKNVACFFPIKYTQKYSSPNSFLSYGTYTSFDIVNTSNEKTHKDILCKYFLYGKCDRENCEFSHKLKDFSDEHILNMLNEHIEERVEIKQKNIRKPSFKNPLQNLL
ncbi:hypothetical protein EHP00_1299 [Ecytonucleospora hepatopenaei]|uniref:C3H1-type domain-containing protein n=1 Tax=Ecytonucleospora hepatopenaei TaxID=646526 RepID=A0A1W0E6X3_9MICR|nr:hypothetical protein EHP00_1299 [Ecytonucleospora hepatopenaei]